ncbi:MAG: c-type cytochrome domain-containing protein [Nannocystaceae bacterium]
MDDCALLYPPQWAYVFGQTLLPGCGAGVACHASDQAAGAVGGLVFDASTRAYARLLAGPRPLVVAGDPWCSPLILRLESEDPAFRMPPGNTALAAGARCSIARWISDGALP